MKSVRNRLTYANVMSSIAVFLVVAGGTAFAASQLGKETVGTRQLKKEAVSLAKINAAAKSSLQGATGPAGPKGATGSEGPRGATGAAGAEGARGERGEKGEKGDTGPSTGPAGGALTGNYPDPSLATGAVTSGAIADAAVTASKLGTITTVEKTEEVAPESSLLLVNNCGSGNVLLNIGYAWNAESPGLYAKDSYKFLEAGVLRAENTTKAAHKVTLQLLCLVN